MPNKKTLNEICEYCRTDYCLLKELCSMNDRSLKQMKLIEEYKWCVSKEQGQDLGWDEAVQKWVGDGLAEKFAEIYKEGVTVLELRKKIFKDLSGDGK